MKSDTQIYIKSIAFFSKFTLKKKWKKSFIIKLKHNMNAKGTTIWNHNAFSKVTYQNSIHFKATDNHKNISFN